MVRPWVGLVSTFSDRQTFIKVPKSKTASIFSDKQTFIKVPKSKTAYSREDIFGHAERQAPSLCLGINTCFLE